MKRVILCGVTAVAASVGGTASAGTYDDSGAWYLAPMGTYSLLDDKRTTKDDFGEALSIGKNFQDQWAAELGASNGSYDRKYGLGGHEELSAYSVDFIRKFFPDSIVRPYVIFGGGMLTDTFSYMPKNNTWMAEAGLGLLTGLGDQTGPVRVQLRTEAKYRREFIQDTAYIPNNPGDVVFDVGLQLSFGNPTPRPPVAAAPPPPPPPVEAAPPPPAPCHAPAGFQVDANCRIIEQSVIVRAVDFEFNSTQLTAPAQQTLDEVATALIAQPELTVEIQGYTDSIGTAAYNLNLSQRRADAVKAYLVSKGLNTSALTAKGYGKANPIAGNDTAEGRAQNRRVAFAVTNAPAHVKVVTKDASAASTEAAEQGAQPTQKEKEKQQQQ